MQSSEHAAEVDVDPPYREATINFNANSVAKHNEAQLMNYLEHEIQHVALHMLDSLLLTVNAMLKGIAAEHEEATSAVDAMRYSLALIFRDTNEQVRSLLGRLTQRGNKYDEVEKT